MPGRLVGVVPLALFSWCGCAALGFLGAVVVWPPEEMTGENVMLGLAVLGLAVFMVFTLVPFLICAALVVQVRRWCAPSMPGWAATGLAVLAALAATMGLVSLGFGVEGNESVRTVLSFGLPNLVPMLLPLVGEHRAQRRGFRLAWWGSSSEQVGEPPWPPVPTAATQRTAFSRPRGPGSPAGRTSTCGRPCAPPGR